MIFLISGCEKGRVLVRYSTSSSVSTEKSAETH